MAANLGFAVTLAGDSCFTFDRRTPDGATLAADAVHQAHLASLHGEFATVTDTDAILAALGP
jgi:nicotinamidase-related amidase